MKHFGVPLLALALTSRAAFAQTEVVKKDLRLGGLSEQEVLSLLVPSYEEPQETSAKTEGEPDWNVTRAHLTESLTSTFGLGKTELLLAAANGTQGQCAQCAFAVVGLIDPAKRSLLWRLEPQGYGASGLQTITLSKDDRRTCIRFRYDVGSHEHNSYLREAIYRLSSSKVGETGFQLVWQDLVSSRDDGSWGGMRHESCGSMVASKGREWVYTRRTFFGNTVETLEEDAEDDSSTEPPCEGTGTEIRRQERWKFSSATGRLTLVSATNVRIDHGASTTFPFSLPSRSGAWKRTGKGSPGRESEVGVSASPDGRFRVARPTPARRVALVLVDQKGAEIRTLGDWQGGEFFAVAESVGWADDGSRFFVVAAFENERVLLSFSVAGIDDWWEGLLSPYAPPWPDGFVMQRGTSRSR